MWFKPVDYYKSIKHFQDLWYKVNKDIDTTVYGLDLTPHHSKTIVNEIYKYSLNTNAKYLRSTAFPEIVFLLDHQVSTYHSTINITMITDERTFKAFNLYLSTDVSKITCYGLFYRFCKIRGYDPQEILTYILNNFYIEWYSHIIRQDVAVDILGISTSHFYDHLEQHNDLTKRTGRQFVNKWQLNTIEIGAKTSKTIYTRIYNKYEDNKNKGKLSMYRDYTNPTVRIEAQMWSQFLKWLTQQEIKEKVNSWLWFPSDWQGNYFISNRYWKDVIHDIEAYKTRWVNSTLKIMKNGIDLRGSCQYINRQQNRYRLRCNLPE